MNPSVSLKFHYSKTDVAQAMRAHYRRQLRLWVDIPVVILLTVSGMYFGRSQEFHWYAVGLLGVAGIFVLMLIAAFVIFPYLAFSRQPKFREEFALNFSREGIHFQTAHIDSQLTWDLYTHALTSAHSYLLYYGSRDLTIIPKRVFEGAEQRALFEKLIAQEIPKITHK